MSVIQATEAFVSQPDVDSGRVATGVSLLGEQVVVSNCFEDLASPSSHPLVGPLFSWGEQCRDSLSI